MWNLILCVCVFLSVENDLNNYSATLWTSEYHRGKHYSLLVKFWKDVCVFRILPRWRKHPGENMHVTGKVFLKGVCSRVWLNGRVNYWQRIIFTPCPETSQGDSMSSWKHSISTVSVAYSAFWIPPCPSETLTAPPRANIIQFLNKAQSWKCTKVEWLLKIWEYCGSGPYSVVTMSTTSWSS